MIGYLMSRIDNSLCDLKKRFYAIYGVILVVLALRFSVMTSLTFKKVIYQTIILFGVLSAVIKIYRKRDVRNTSLSIYYLISRIRLKYYETMNLSPWLVENAIKFMDAYLKPKDKILEFGAGRSTAWFLEKGCLVRSIETNEEWFVHVKKSNEGFIGSGSLDLRKTYQVSDKTDRYDCILIDGGDREEAARLALSVIKPGGIIVFDNVERYMPTAITDTPAHVLLKRETPGFRDCIANIKNFEVLSIQMVLLKLLFSLIMSDLLIVQKVFRHYRRIL